MEIKINTNISTTFTSGKINYIISPDKKEPTNLLNLLYLIPKEYKGSIKYNKDEVTMYSPKEQISRLRENIFYIPKDFKSLFINFTLIEDINCLIDKIDKDKLNKLLIDFDLKSNILEKSYNEVSLGELKKIIIICMLLSNKQIFLIDDITLYLDYKSKNTLIKKLKHLKKEDKCIIISSSDTDFMLEIVDKIYIINRDKVNIYTDKYIILENDILMKQNNLEVPKTLEFRNKVLKEKNIRLMHRDNISDLLKDIYNHAK